MRYLSEQVPADHGGSSVADVGVLPRQRHKRDGQQVHVHVLQSKGARGYKNKNKLCMKLPAAELEFNRVPNYFLGHISIG